MKNKIILIGILVGLGLFLLVTKSSLLEEERGIKSLLPLRKPTETPWQTYKNQKYSYRLLYPAGWEREEWDIQEAANLKRVPNGSIWHQAKFSGEESHFEVLIWENRSRTTVRNWLTWFRHEDLILKEVPKEENFSVAGLPAIRFVQKETAKDKPLLYIFFGQEDKVYELVMTREDLARIATPSARQLVHLVYDKMIGSFKFLGE